MRVSAIVGIFVCCAALGGGASSARQASERIRARPLPLTAVRLTGGPLKHAQDLDAAYLRSLEPDRMLAFYRIRAGLAAKAEPYGGWDGDGRNLTGHVAGHYLSAVSLMYAATGDAEFKRRADYLVSELEAVQVANGDGYLGALERGRDALGEAARGDIRSSFFDLNGLWSPWYTLHKTFAGLRDAYRHTGNRTALDVEAAFAAWTERLLAPLDDAGMQRMLNTEFGGMNEVLADLYADTNDDRWLRLSRRFEHQAVLDPLRRGEDPLDGLHGNTQVPKLLGSAARYVYAGDAADLRAATTFWERVVFHHTFATGGHGKDEYFREPDRLSQITGGRTAETCNVYNMLKLTRLLFGVAPDVRYAEFHERALFNHILGSIDPADGATCYMVPVGQRVRREYQKMSSDFTCCVGTGMESHALHALGLYYEAGDRLWVNLFVPSTARWQAMGVELAVQTDLPLGESVTISLSAPAPKPFTLSLRRPSWAGDGFRVAVNGKAVATASAPGSYLDVARTWRNGDTVTLTLPKTLRIEAASGGTTPAAIAWGPLVLAGDLGPDPGDGPLQVGDEPVVLAAAGRPVSGWLREVAGEPGHFRTSGVGLDRDVDLRPFYQLHRRTYAAYWTLVDEREAAAIRAGIAKDRERLAALERRTLVSVPIGDEAREKAFNLQGEGSSTLEMDGRFGRRAGAGKWFSVDIPSEGAAPLAIVLTLNTDTRRPKRFAVRVDGERIGEHAMDASSVSKFVDIELPIPSALTSGKPRLTVKVQGVETSEVPTIVGLRLVRSAP